MIAAGLGERGNARYHTMKLCRFRQQQHQLQKLHKTHRCNYLFQTLIGERRLCQSCTRRPTTFGSGNELRQSMSLRRNEQLADAWEKWSHMSSASRSTPDTLIAIFQWSGCLLNFRNWINHHWLPSVTAYSLHLDVAPSQIHTCPYAHIYSTSI